MNEASDARMVSSHELLRHIDAEIGKLRLCTVADAAEIIQKEIARGVELLLLKSLEENVDSDEAIHAILRVADGLMSLNSVSLCFGVRSQVRIVLSVVRAALFTYTDRVVTPSISQKIDPYFKKITTAMDPPILDIVCKKTGPRKW